MKIRIEKRQHQLYLENISSMQMLTLIKKIMTEKSDVISHS